MTRPWLLIVPLMALGLAACGPDCLKYCSKLDSCAQELQTARPDIAKCLASCDAVGDDMVRVVRCVIDRTCGELQAGHCTPTGGNQATQP
jgi:hypothetical protein